MTSYKVLIKIFFFFVGEAEAGRVLEPPKRQVQSPLPSIPYVPSSPVWSGTELRSKP